MGPMDASSQSALTAATQIAGTLKDAKNGDFFQIYNNLLLSDSISKIFDDGTGKNASQSNADDSLSGLGGNFQSLLTSIPGLNTPQNIDISHVEVDGNNGKVVFSDGSSKTVPIQTATSAATHK